MVFGLVYELFNAAAHLSMMLLVLYILAFMVVPALLIGLGGIIGPGFIKGHLPTLPFSLKEAPQKGFSLVEKGCNLAAWPIIQAYALARGVQTAIAALRRLAAHP